MNLVWFCVLDAKTFGNSARTKWYFYLYCQCLGGVLGFATLTLGPFGSLHSPPAKLESDKCDDSTADQTGWLD